MIVDQDNIDDKGIGIGIQEFLFDLRVHKDKEITISNLLGYVNTEKKYTLEDYLTVETNLGYSVFLKLKDDDISFTFEIPNIYRVESNLISVGCIKYWLTCRNEHFYQKMLSYIDYNNRSPLDTVTYKELKENDILKSLTDDDIKHLLDGQHTIHRLILFSE